MRSLMSQQNPGPIVALCFSMPLVARAQDLESEDSLPPPVRCLAFSPDGSLLAGSSADMFTRGEMIIWDTKNFEPRWRHSEPVGFPRFAFSPEGHSLALSRFAPETKLFNVETGKMFSQLEGHTNHARCVTYTPDGTKIVTGSYDRTIKIWEADSGQLLRTLEGHTSPVYHVAVSPDGKLLASADKDAHAAYLWNLVDGTQQHIFDSQGSLVPHVGFSPDGLLLTVASWGGHVSLYDTRTFKTHMRIREIGGAHWAEFSPDGHWLALVTNSTKVYVFPTETKLKANAKQKTAELLARLDDDSYELRETAHAELARVGAAAQEQLLKAQASKSPEVRWRARRLRRRLASPDSAVQLTDHRAEMECVTFSPDGRLLASGDRDGQVKVWRTDDWSLVQSLAIPNDTRVEE